MHSKILHGLLRTARNRNSAHRKGQQGFTLVELLIVVVIIGILSAVGIPAYLNQAQKARENAAKAGAMNAARACAAALAGGSKTDFVLPNKVTGTCEDIGTASTFTFSDGGTSATATVTSAGAVQ